MLALILSGAITFVPLDDRPVSLQLPVLLGRIAGIRVNAPPLNTLGRYLVPGNPDAIIAWLNAPENTTSDAIVVSTDMLAYGGLVASRTPSTPYDAAYFRVRALQQMRVSHPRAWIAAFGTIMRLAPTGVPALGPAANYFAAYPAWTYLQQYANLNDPPLPSERATAEALKSQLGPTLDAYLDARNRNYGIDREILALTADRTIDRAVIGQDDAGPVGLHIKEVHALQQAAITDNVAGRASIEPGADELGMVLVAHALARRAHWTPRVGVVYSSPLGQFDQDPLEFGPISVAIEKLIALGGGVRDDEHPDIVLAIHTPSTNGVDEPFVDNLTDRLNAGQSIALVDLSFMNDGYALQAGFIERILSEGMASRIDAYAAWNTNANSVGTALAEAIAAGAGRRMGTYDENAHREFTFMRFVDDGAFHDDVRPKLNDTLVSQGIADHTYLLPDVAAPIESLNNTLLWNDAASILPRLYPGEHIAAIHITLPWQRTFETQIDVRLAPDLR